MPGKNKNKGAQKAQPAPTPSKAQGQGQEGAGKEGGLEGAPESMAQLQEKLMSMVNGLKEGVLGAGGPGGLGKDMIDDLFKNLLGDFNLPNSSVDKNEYFNSEEAHQNYMKQVDESLVEIERVYEKIFKGEIEEFPALAEEEKKVEISPQDEKKLQQDDQRYPEIQKKLALVQSLEDAELKLIDDLPADSTSKVHADLIKKANSISKNLYNSHLNYLRTIWLESKGAKKK